MYNIGFSSFLLFSIILFTLCVKLNILVPRHSYRVNLNGLDSE